MKKRLFKVLVVFCLTMIFMLPVYAHPGRTDSNGGHYCRTNCAKWGLKDGEYHYHNGGGSSNSNNSNQSDNSNQSSNTQPVDYTQKGKTEGYAYKKANPNADKQDLSNRDGTYIKGYEEGYNQALSELTDLSTQTGKTNGDQDGRTTESYNLSVPDGLINDIYIAKYKENYDVKEKELFEEIDTCAREKATSDSWNLEDAHIDDNQYTLQKEKGRYEKTYHEIYDQEQAAIDELTHNIEDYAQKDYDDNQKMSTDSYKKYKGYKVYNQLDKKYKKAFQKYQEEQETDHSLTGIVAIAVLGGGTYFGVKKYKEKKKANT